MSLPASSSSNNITVQQQPQQQQQVIPHTPLTQLIATAGTLETDLRNLCVESRRKYPELQSSAERALVKLRAMISAGQVTLPAGVPPVTLTKPAIDVLHSDTIIRPFLLACATKSSKLTLLSLTSLQKLVSLTPLSPRFLATIMGTLRIQAECDDQTIQLKILQTLLLCISPSAVESGELLCGSLLSVLMTCFRLFLPKKSPMIHHTAFAALRQTMTLLFDRVMWQSEQQTMWMVQGQQLASDAASAASSDPSSAASSSISSSSPTPNSALLPPPLDRLSYEAQNAYLLFQDLCLLASPASSSSSSFSSDPNYSNGAPTTPTSAHSSRPKWLTNLSSPISPEICIELLENILSNSSSLFMNEPIFFQGLIKNTLMPILIRQLRSGFEFSMVLRLVRILVLLIKYYHEKLYDEIDIILSLFIRMLNHEFPLWHRILILEGFLMIMKLKQETFVYWIFRNYDVVGTQVQALITTAASQPLPQPNPNQTRIFTSLVHALSKLIVSTASQLSEGASPTLATSTGSLGVGSQGYSSALITLSSVTPAVSITVPPSPASQSSSASNSKQSQQFGSFDPSSNLHWKLYSNKSRGLDLLNLEQTSDGASALPIYEEAYVITLGVECITTIVNGLAALAKTNEKAGGGNVNANGKIGASSTTNGDDLNSPASSSSSTLLATASFALSNVDLAILRAICNTSCLPVLGALSYLLNCTNEEAQIQQLLMSYQSYTNTAGILEATKSRDVFLQNLAGFALPNNGLSRDDPPSELSKSLFGGSSGSSGGSGNSAAISTSTNNLNQLLSTQEGRVEFSSNLHKILLTPKNIQALKALFNISYCLGHVLGSSSWLTILETFQTLDTIIQLSNEVNWKLSSMTSTVPSSASSSSSSSLTGSSASSSSQQNWNNEMYQSLLPHQTEINIMASALSRLFESTRYLDDQAVIHVLSALGTLSLSSLANAATSEGGERGSNVGVSGGASSGGAHTATLPSNVTSLNLSLSPPTTIRMFALMNLIATLEHNLFRLTRAHLWEMGIGHLTCVINHKDSHIRQYGVAALTKITMLALAKQTTYQQVATTLTNGTSATNSTVSTPTNASLAQQQIIIPTPLDKKVSTKSLAALSALSQDEYQSAIQSSLLEPFTDLFRSKYDDTRENILRSLYQILQNSGQYLVRGGWKRVLNILQAVVQPNVFAVNTDENEGVLNSNASSAAASANGSNLPASTLVPTLPAASSSASFIHVGFNSIQLITNDYLESIPYTSLSALISTIAAYCSQVSDTNISFTSIGLLWRVSDYLAKLNTKQQQSSVVPQQQQSVAVSNEQGANVVPTPAPLLTSQLADELMQLVFTSLSHLCTDQRTEVRNSAVKTLHNTLVAHSSRISIDSALVNISTLILPLLSRLLLEKSLETRISNNSTELGKDKTTGKSVMMLIHYSRDTAQKQWDETRVYALQGTARVMKGYTENIIRNVMAPAVGNTTHSSLLSTFLPHWLQFIELNLAALGNRSPEVSLAALNSVYDVVQLLTPFMSHPLIRSLSSPLYEKFYIPGVIHSLVQVKYLEELEEREKMVEKEKKERKGSAASSSAAVSSTSSTIPFTSSYQTDFGDMSSEDAWKTWMKTQTQMMTHFQTIILHATTKKPNNREGISNQEREQNDRDIVLALTLSHILACCYTEFADRRAYETWITRKGINTTEIPPDRKETPIQTAHIKTLDAVCGNESANASGAALNQSQIMASTVSPSIWSTVSQQVHTYLLSDYPATDITEVESRLRTLLTSSSTPSNNNKITPAALASPAPQVPRSIVTPPPMYGVDPSPPHRPASAAAPAPIRSPVVRQTFSSTLPLTFPSSLFAQKILRSYTRAFLCTTDAIQYEQLSSVLSILHRILLSSTSDARFRGELAEECLASFNQLLEVGLHAINSRMNELMRMNDANAIEVERAKIESVWKSILEICTMFLAPANAISNAGTLYPSPLILPQRTSLTPSQQRLWENLQIAVVGCLLRSVFPSIVYAQPSTRAIGDRLIRLLNIGYEDAYTSEVEATRSTSDSTASKRSIDTTADDSASGSPNSAAATAGVASVTNELLSHTCLLALFELVRRGNTASSNSSTGGTSQHDSVHLLIASLSAPLLLHRCRTILSQYLELDRLAQVPPRCRREEVAFILRELAALTVPKEISKQLIESAQTGQQTVVSSTRGHLFRLFPVLVQCITLVRSKSIRDGELRELLRDVFQLATSEMGLQAS